MLRRSADRLSAIGGIPEVKEVSDAIASHGFILKKNVTMESKMSGGMGPMSMLMRAGGQKRTTSTVVTAIRDETLAPARFVLPQDYAEIGMMNPNRGAMPDLSKLPGRPDARQQPGAQQPGAQQPGAQQPGAQQPGAHQPGAQQPDNAAPQMPDLNNIPK